MKKSELRKLVSEYKEIQKKIKKSQNQKLNNKLKELRHRYFHETGKDIDSD